MAPYALRLALQSLIREKWINLLSILTIASGLLVISVTLFAAYNIDAATRKLPEKFSLILYLEDNTPQDRLENILAVLKKKRAVSSVRFISKEEALKELRGLLKNSNYVFEGLDENPLPDSIEVKLKKEAVTAEAAKKISEEALTIKGVREVDYGEKFLAAIHSVRSGVTTIGIALITIISVGIIFVCYSTVKILFYRRSDEIETFKLLGATKTFIRMPFLIEGGIIGAGGGLATLVGVMAFYYIVIARLSPEIPLLSTLLFPQTVFFTLPLIGLFLGIAGAAIAIGRLRY
ncbi:MAG: cell division protein FtsX [Thermodesulfovibrionales bacterium]